MDELRARHRKEAKDLQARVTAKKKSASKKTRKGINDECDRLEQDLKAKQAAELAAVDADAAGLDNSEAQEEQDRGGVSPTTNGHGTDSIGGRLAASAEALRLDDRTDTTTQAGSEAADLLSPLSPASNKTTPADAETSGSRRPSRAKARLERRRQASEALAAEAEDEAQSLPDLRAAERARMEAEFKKRGLVEHEVRADGHCLYSAFADQLDRLPGSLLVRDVTVGQQPFKAVRGAAAGYMLDHGDDFAPFLEEDLEGYARKVRDTAEWGGQLELMALARRYGVHINVLQGDGRVEEIKPEGDAPTGSEEEQVCWLAYYRHGFGLGEHYNSLRKVG